MCSHCLEEFTSLWSEKLLGRCEVKKQRRTLLEEKIQTISRYQSWSSRGSTHGGGAGRCCVTKLSLER